ncbi:hypothetical protein GQR58_012661 [Nymphon striatum]|nr:hypothetical protein GQR58_012661 [Nymphon striatum]KAG1680060.1 hypothetical protein GQR58_012661 [Nymphon striatum]
MDSVEFYVNLPSNSLSYSDNTPSSYSVRLAKPLNLIGDYEVGLTEYSGPASRYNITMAEIGYWTPHKVIIEDINMNLNNDNLRIDLFSTVIMLQVSGLTISRTPDGVEINYDPKENSTILVNKEVMKNYGYNDEFLFSKDKHTFKGKPVDFVNTTILSENSITIRKLVDDYEKKINFSIKPNSYTSITSLIKAINKQITMFAKLNLANNFVKITLKEDNGTFHINSDFAQLLGFSIGTYSVVKKVDFASTSAELEIAKDVYIYTNIIEYNFVGDTLSPLLRTISYSLKKNQQAYHVNFLNPYYHRVSMRYIDEITIKITDHRDGDGDGDGAGEGDGEGEGKGGEEGEGKGKGKGEGGGKGKGKGGGGGEASFDNI